MTLPQSVLLLTRLLTEEPLPTDFDITILNNQEDEYHPQKIVKMDSHLAIHAGDLPQLAQEFRKCYYKERTRKQQHHQQNHLHSITSCLLLVCPDHATAWADRKRYLVQQQACVEILYKELVFLNLLMTKHSKAPNSWIHRKWLLKRLFASQDIIDIMDLIRNEIQLCIAVATKFPKNYYAWTHRIFVIDSIMVSSCDGSKADQEAVLQDELNSMEPWLRRHVSDHSAVHYGGHVLRLLLKKFSGDNKIAEGALESARRLVDLYPTHEALWIWRRLCGHGALSCMEGSGKKQFDSSTIATENAAALQRFVESEVIELLDAAKQAQKELDTTLSRGEVRLELQQTQRHRLSYMIWIMEQARRCNVILEEANGPRTQDVFALLAEQDFPHNVWRQPQSASLFA